ncbi:hypothetical protein AGMMS50276_06750 [Synergistales bacterium]|nr:hypothetical protein AGMMS50276_06750 [Synergistales bacterium]
MALPDSALENIGKMVFSVSGMTQANYGRIHGFEIESVLENIRAWCKDLDRAEMQDRTMSFHSQGWNTPSLTYDFIL